MQRPPLPVLRQAQGSRQRVLYVYCVRTYAVEGFGRGAAAPNLPQRRASRKSCVCSFSPEGRKRTYWKEHSIVVISTSADVLAAPQQSYHLKRRSSHAPTSARSGRAAFFQCMGCADGDS